MTSCTSLQEITDHTFCAPDRQEKDLSRQASVQSSPLLFYDQQFLVEVTFWRLPLFPGCSHPRISVTQCKSRNPHSTFSTCPFTQWEFSTGCFLAPVLPGLHNIVGARVPESIFQYWLSKLNDPWHPISVIIFMGQAVSYWTSS